MALETKFKLTDEIARQLQSLIQVNVDAQKGFEEAAEKVDDINLSSMFQELAVQRSTQAMELQSLVSSSGKTPEQTGTISGTAHRAWMDLRSAFGGGNQMILNETERGEDHIKAKYEEALKCCTGTSPSEILNRQYAAVKKAHDRVRDLRDSYSE